MKCPFVTKKDKQAFFRRLVVLLIVYLMVMTGVWSALNFLFFRNGLSEPWQIWVFVGASVLLFVGLIIVVEWQRYKQRMVS